MASARTKDEEAAVPARDVVLVAFDGAEAIDVAAPASVFTKAGQLCPGAYRLHVASPGGGTVQTNSGLGFGNTCRLQDAPAGIDTLVVAGGDEAPLRAAIREQGIGAWLAEVAPRTRRIASVCSGAFALAAAGLLDGRQATTHWRSLDLLQKIRPQVRVQRECIYVRDGRVWTSAGVTTSLELALALVEDDLGHAVAMDIARTLALPLLRGAAQPQLSQALEAQGAATRRLRELVAWIGTHPKEDLSVEALAARARMSPRHFARAFAAETGCTPARFVEQARVAAAAQLLRRTRWTQERIAERSGFGSVDALQRAFARRFGTTPRAYREEGRQAC
ncbi:MAG TPA: DJ-1/PfpI family protein [Burkholderiales bacterium]|nr:DJ-1/PfpI family protein [Burkholderiales bacterium]